MCETSPLLDKWIQENNDLVTKWKKQRDANALVKEHVKEQPYTVRSLSLEFHKLLTKIQGAPHLGDSTELELTVMYNASVFSIALSEFSKAELLITNTIDKIFQIVKYNPECSGYILFWRKVSEKTQMHPSFQFYIGQLFCLQWAIWLATQKYSVIRQIEKELSDVSAAIKNNGKLCKALLLVLEPKDLVELLHICTLIEQGAQRLTDGQYSEAVSDMKKASFLPAPRALVACTHLISGSCFAHMKHHQMALVCFRNALETDCHCVSALYQSMLIYRQLGNKQAEIKALELLHSSLNVTSPPEFDSESGQLISSSLLLSSPSLKNLLIVPSALALLHSLALRCVLHGSLSEGVEHYMDLLASLQTEQQNLCSSVPVPALPHLTDLYLEAAAALLMVQRPADCIALCDEVVGTTIDLLPERLVLEELDQDPETVPQVNPDKVAMVFWVGAAYLLQGHCHIHLKNWKQAITHYTRCIDLLLKVQFKNKGCQPLMSSTDMDNSDGPKLSILQRLKAFSFASRGICFAQTDQLKEALRDLQLSLHTFPECGFAGRWCGEVLWRLKRRHEAASCWKNLWNFSADSSKKHVCMYLLEPPTDHLMNLSELHQRIKDLGLEEDKNRLV